MNTIEAKRIRIVDYLRLLGHEPVKVRGGQYWYLSPLRKEDTPSFKVNDRLNEWYDFGLSEGGSIIELAMLFLRTSSVSEVLRLIEVQTGAAPLLRTRPHNAMPDAIEEMMKGVEVVPLNHHALLSYIHSRGIDTQTARQFCRGRYTTNCTGGITSPSPSGTYRAATRCAILIIKGASGRKTFPSSNRQPARGRST